MYFLVIFFLLLGMCEAHVEVFRNALLVRNKHLEKGDLWIENGTIVAPQERADIEHDLTHVLVAPGYIDIQINGAFGIDFSQAPGRTLEVAHKLPQYGVTAFLPTVISSKEGSYPSILTCLRLQMENQEGHGASILGFHLEGPFFNPARCNAHNPDFLQNCETFKDPSLLYGDLEGVRIITLAPELPGAGAFIRKLSQQGILISAGHSSATLEELERGCEAGISLVTHLFNAMVPFHHRAPGIIGAVLTEPKLAYSIIGDPYHVHPKALALAWRAHPEGLILVSDAMAALGLASGSYHLGTLDVEVMEGRAFIKGTRTIAGSVIGLDSAVRFLHESAGCSIAEAIEAATLKPARLLGIEKQKGTLEIGSDADFVLLSEDLFVQKSYVAGRLVYQRS